jgi:hypothetical protein
LRIQAEEYDVNRVASQMVGKKEILLEKIRSGDVVWFSPGE